MGFRMKVLRSHKTPLTRQIQEGVEINNSTANIIMNSKGEWNGSRIPRVVIEVGEKLQEEIEDTETGTRRWTDSKIKKSYKRERGEKEKKRRGETGEIEETELRPPVKKRRKSGPGGTEHTERVISGCGTTQNGSKLSGKAKLTQFPRCDLAQRQTECGNSDPGDSKDEYYGQEGGPAQSKQAKDKCVTEENEPQMSECGQTELKHVTDEPRNKCATGKKNEEQISECGQAEPEYEHRDKTFRLKNDSQSDYNQPKQAGAKLSNTKAQMTAKTRPKNGPDKYQKQSQAIKNWLVHRQTKVETECEPDPLSRTSTECGVELTCTLQNDALYQAVETYEICNTIVVEIVREVLGARKNKLGLGGTQFETEQSRGKKIKEKKRKFEDQPSIQKEKRRKTDFIEGGGISREENNKMGLCKEKFKTERDRMKFWLRKENGNQPNNVKRRNSSAKTPEIKRIKFKKKNEPILKGNTTKRGKLGEKVGSITKFFETLQKEQNTASGGWRGGGNTRAGGGVGYSASGKVEHLSLDRGLRDYSGCADKDIDGPSEI